METLEIYSEIPNSRTTLFISSLSLISTPELHHLRPPSSGHHRRRATCQFEGLDILFQLRLVPSPADVGGRRGGARKQLLPSSLLLRARPGRAKAEVPIFPTISGLTKRCRRSEDFNCRERTLQQIVERICFGSGVVIALLVSQVAFNSLSGLRVWGRVVSFREI